MRDVVIPDGHKIQQGEFGDTKMWKTDKLSPEINDPSRISTQLQHTARSERWVLAVAPRQKPQGHAQMQQNIVQNRYAAVRGRLI